MAAVTKQHAEATEMYETRKKDRKDETEAVNKALDVLSDSLSTVTVFLYCQKNPVDGIFSSKVWLDGIFLH